MRGGDGWLRLTVLDVGQGDVAVVETPDRRALVIHGRPGATGRFDVGERVVAPFLWNRGLLVLDAVLDVTGRTGGGSTLAALPRLFRIRHDWPPAAGSVGPLAVSTLGPYGETRTGDLVVGVRREYGLASLLLVPGLEAGHEGALLASDLDLRAAMLVVPRHGSRRATSSALLAATRPAIAVVSVGARNAQGHPDPETLARLAAAGADVYRTDRDGAVTVETDGRVLDVSTWASRRRARYCLDPEAPCAQWR
jgi:competence protein ComEC